MSYEHVGLRISRDPGAVPSPSQIGEGELAFNLVDGRVFALLGGAVVDITDGYTRAEIDALTASLGERIDDLATADIAGLDAALSARVQIAHIVDTLTDTRIDRPLSANQGRVLRGAIDAINAVLASDDTTLDELQEVVDYIKANREDLANLSIGNIAGLETALAGKVEKQSGKGLSTNDYTTAEKAKLAGVGSMANRNIHVAQRAPTGSDGGNGDLWFQY